MALRVDPVQGAGGVWVPRRGPREFADAGYCGRSFDEGMLRFHDAQTGPNYRELVFAGFPELGKIDRKADVLAFDWNGKQYLTAKVPGERDVQVLVADLGAGELSRLASVAQFAAVLKLDNVGEFFDVGLFNDWKQQVGEPDAQLGFSDCVEYQVPLYLGGADDVSNLQLGDMDVSWTIGVQIMNQKRPQE
jgi:hypothetical protein